MIVHEARADAARCDRAESRLRIAVVVPCFNVGASVLEVLARIGPEVEAIYVVDDLCPAETWRAVASANLDPRVQVLRHSSNRGVGAATLTGMRAAFAAGATVAVKVDGDGQMDPALIPRLVAPIARGDADFVKGNRFWDLEGIKAMPAVRLVGNAALSFITKASSGYWQVFDPTNGFLALHRVAFGALPVEKLAERYFFESDLLFRLYTIRARVVDMPMAAAYGEERSNLRVPRVVVPFLVGHTRNLAKRILYTYFLRDFGIATIYLLLGTVLVLAGLGFGAWHWAASFRQGAFASAGTVMAAALPFLTGCQLLIGFLTIDVGNAPERALQHDLPDVPAAASAAPEGS